MTTILLTKNAIYADSRGHYTNNEYKTVFQDDVEKISFSENMDSIFAISGYAEFKRSVLKWNKIPKYFITNTICGETFYSTFGSIEGNILGINNSGVWRSNIYYVGKCGKFCLWKNEYKFYENVSDFDYWTSGSGQNFLLHFINRIGKMKFMLEIDNYIQDAFDYVARNDRYSNNKIQCKTIEAVARTD